MRHSAGKLVLVLGLTVGSAALAQTTAPASDPVTVTIDNYVRAESNANMAGYVARGAFGQWLHSREMVDVDNQIVIRSNVDTLYSFAIIDLTTPATIFLPDPGERFQSLQCASEEHSIPPTVYGPGFFTYTRDMMGTRYAFCAVRTFADPTDSDDMAAAHALQDEITLEQANAGTFQIPDWDADSLASIRQNLQTLALTRDSTSGYFGIKEDLNPLYWILGAASGWGGNPVEAAVYQPGTVEDNSGQTPYVLEVPKDVPVDAFWSVTLYDARGYLPKNDSGRYSFNSATATPNDDGSFTITFGGDGPNNFDLVEGWNYIVRMYRPKQELIDGLWRFPAATPAE